MHARGRIGADALSEIFRRAERVGRPGRLDAAVVAAVHDRARDLRGRRTGEEPQPGAPGSRIGGCTIEAELARGGMGQVYRASRGGQPVAVKVLHPRRSAGGEDLERFRREAEAAAALAHPGLVGALVHGYDPGAKRHYIVYEYVDGGSLRDAIDRRGPLSEPEVVAIARDAAAALEHLEARGVVHRDLKPENVLLTGDGRAKLADLGLALQDGLSSLTGSDIVVGTPVYMAPEIILDEQARAGARSDLWSLGLCLWEAAAGRLPFDADAPWIAPQLDEDVSDVRIFRPEASDGLAQVLAGLVARDPAARYARAADLRADLERLERGELPLGPGAAASAPAEASGPVLAGALPAVDEEPAPGAPPRRRRPRTSAEAARRRGPAVVLTALVALAGLLLSLAGYEAA